MDPGAGDAGAGRGFRERGHTASSEEEAHVSGLVASPAPGPHLLRPGTRAGEPVDLPDAAGADGVRPLAFGSNVQDVTAENAENAEGHWASHSAASAFSTARFVSASSARRRPRVRPPGRARPHAS